MVAILISGTLPINHAVDLSGPFTAVVKLQSPPSRIHPELSLAYHSTATEVSTIGEGWVLKGVSSIERIFPTIAQDGLRAAVKYDSNDCFALDGQRLKRIGSTNEYRFEVEQWSKIVAYGDLANPTSWMQYLPDGTTRSFGTTTDSNVKACGNLSWTRVWAVSETRDHFSNYITFKYSNETSTGAYYVESIKYGGNDSTLTIGHNRDISFVYETRPDVRKRYLGGYLISTTKRLKTITSTVLDKKIYSYSLLYAMSPLTKLSRLTEIHLTDAIAARVSPLNFSWNDADPKVFDPTESLALISLPANSLPQIIPIEVSGDGLTDVVIASMQHDSKLSKDCLFLDTYLANVDGTISTTSAPGSGSTGLVFATIMPLDINGDGKMDLLHILKGTDTFSLTVLLSTNEGYKKQDTVSFKPEAMKGYFYTGDFDGSGCVGLVYVYQTGEKDKDTRKIKFTQFTSDGRKLTNLSAKDGPKKSDLDIDSMTMIVGDLDGDGDKDLFLVHPNNDTSPVSWTVYYVESVNGVLTYRTDDPLAKCAKQIQNNASTVILPFNADGDSKVGLLFAWKDSSENLTLELLRSTGTTLIADQGAIDTGVKYGSSVIVTRVTSAHSLDLVNIVDSSNGPTFDVFRFNSVTFEKVPNVQQPFGAPQGSIVRWADLRGVGRSDCLLNTVAASGAIRIRVMHCTKYQPLDTLSDFSNGLGATVKVSYATLSDPKIYSPATVAITSLINAFSGNCAWSDSSSNPTDFLQRIECTRAELVYLPSFVVKELVTTPAPSLEKETITYHYRGGSVDFTGRGWLGFASIEKTLMPLGVLEVSEYLQTFPLTHQISKITKTDVNSKEVKTLQVTNYTWKGVSINNGANYSVRLPSLDESYYDGGTLSYVVYVTMTYDNYGNVTLTEIGTSLGARVGVTIESTYTDPSTTPWVVGNKTQEIVKHLGTATMRQVKCEYVPGTALCSKTQTLVEKEGDTSKWSTLSFQFDEAGNKTTVLGPSTKSQTFTYDYTFSHAISTTTSISGTEVLTETATYDLALGLPLTVTTPNGVVMSFEYDVLGRRIKRMQGTIKRGMSVVEEITFASEAGKFKETRSISNGRNGFRKVITYFDGMKRPTCILKSCPDDSTGKKFIHQKFHYDGAGRVTARSRPFLKGQDVESSNYTYDARSRLIEQRTPSAMTGSQTIYRYKYSADSQGLIVVENVSCDTLNQQVTRKMIPIPQADTLSAGNFVKMCVVERINELKESILTVFDGLGRPKSITDPSGVRLLLNYDGLSRETSRELSTKDGKVFSHFKTTFDDENFKITAENTLTGTKVVTATDRCLRPISKTTTEETLAFSYNGERLSAVKSSTGPSYEFTYDELGNLATSSLTLDGKTYTTTFDWTSMGQLLKTTNPNGTSVSRSLLFDGSTVSSLSLADDSKTTQAQVSFSAFDNPFVQPRKCNFSNGLQTSMEVAKNGMVTRSTLHYTSDRTNVLLDQAWTCDAFDKITKYDITTTSTSLQFDGDFGYDDAGQLISWKGKSGSSTSTIDFAYDTSGNITQKDGQTFVNNGWHIKSVKNADGSIAYSFDYSADGNRITKKNSSGTVLSSMAYDSQDRLVDLDKTTFVYDFLGRLVKATAPSGAKTIYVSPTYEIYIPAATSSGSSMETRTTYLNQGYRYASFAVDEDKTSKDATVYYFHVDHLGSTIAVSNKDKTLVAQYRYDAYGKVTSTGDGTAARYKYCGKEMFGSLYYYGARFYDPDTGRFLTIDDFPLSLDDISPRTFNLYLFSWNDPVNYVDANGNAPVPAWHWMVDVALIGAGLTIALAFPVTSPYAIVAISAVVGAAIGGGSGGLLQDVFTAFNGEVTGNEDAEWLKQVSLGAVIGAIAGGVGGVIDVKLTAFFVRASLSGRIMLTGVIRAGHVKFVAKITSDAVLGAAAGAVQQVVTNLTGGKESRQDPWRDVGRSAIIGGVTGLAFGLTIRSGGRYLKLRNRARFVQKLKSGPDPNVNTEYSDHVLYRGLPPVGHNLDFPYVDAAPPSFGENFDFPFIDA